MQDLKLRQLINQTHKIEFKNTVGSSIMFTITSGDVGIVTGTPSMSDWYNQQNMTTGRVDGGTDTTTIKWRSVLPKPRTNSYVSERNGGNDALNIVVIDSDGTVTGNTGAILEKFGNLSKAKDADGSPAKDIYYKNVIANESEYIFAGLSPVHAADDFHNTAPLASAFGSGVTPRTTGRRCLGTRFQRCLFQFHR